MLALLKSPRLQKYLQNVSWLFFEKMLTLFVGMLVSIYIARYLQPERFGLLSYSISFVGIFSAVSALGLDQIIVRELAKNPANKNQLLGTGFVLRLSGFVILLILIAVMLLFMKNTPFTNVLIMIIAAAELFKAFEVINCFYQSQVNSKVVVQTQMLINLVVNVIKIALVFFHAPLIWFAWIILINGAFNATGYIYNYWIREDSPFKWHFDKRLAGIFLMESWPLALHSITLHTQARIDQVMLGKMLNNAEVGQYAVAMKFIEILGFIPMILINTFVPAITKAKNVSLELYEDRLLNFYRLMFAMFLVVAVPLFFVAEPAIVFLYGEEYRAAGFLLSLFALRLFFTNMGVSKSAFIINESLFKFSLLTSTIGAIVNIGANYFLIPLYGSIGAVISSTLSFSISIFVIDLFFVRMKYNQKIMFRGIFSFWKLKEAIKEL
jgi:O-antigen/teichoic acid export membrane protein